MKKQCPHCGKWVKVHDPYEHEEIKRASAWFAAHKSPATGKLCIGSRTCAIARTPRPKSLDAFEV